MTTNLKAAADDLTLHALKSAEKFILNGVEFGYIKMPTVDHDPANYTLPTIQRAIAALAAAPASEGAADKPKCGCCDGTGFVPRDADIGTDQECFCCNGSGVDFEAQSSGGEASEREACIKTFDASEHLRSEGELASFHAGWMARAALAIAPVNKVGERDVPDLAEFGELIDDHQIAQHDGNDDTRASARIALMNAYRAALATDAASMLSNLLARIHRDGGHYEAEHGTQKAVADADNIVARLNAPTDAANHRQKAEASQRSRMAERFAKRKPTPATEDFDLPAPNDATDCASNDAAKGEAKPCSLGVGCEETGVCYALDHGEPSRCGRLAAPEVTADDARILVDRATLETARKWMGVCPMSFPATEVESARAALDAAIASQDGETKS